jgi:tetratricopeptide (TPR) repeat protein
MDDILETADARLLAELGFIALSAGLDRDAAAIFDGLRAARPREEAGPLGLAMVHMARGELDDAVTLLRRLPPSDAAQTYLGLALVRRGDLDEAQTILERVARTAPGTPFADLARAVLDAGS